MFTSTFNLVASYIPIVSRYYTKSPQQQSECQIGGLSSQSVNSEITRNTDIPNVTPSIPIAVGSLGSNGGHSKSPSSQCHSGPSSHSSSSSRNSYYRQSVDSIPSIDDLLGPVIKHINTLSVDSQCRVRSAGRYSLSEFSLDHMVNYIRPQSYIATLINEVMMSNVDLTVDQLVLMIIFNPRFDAMVTQDVKLMRHSLICQAVSHCIQNHELSGDCLTKVLQSYNDRYKGSFHERVLSDTDLGSLIIKCKYNTAKDVISKGECLGQLTCMLKDVLSEVKSHVMISDSSSDVCSSSDGNTDFNEEAQIYSENVKQKSLLGVSKLILYMDSFYNDSDVTTIISQVGYWIHHCVFDEIESLTERLYDEYEFGCNNTTLTDHSQYLNLAVIELVTTQYTRDAIDLLCISQDGLARHAFMMDQAHYTATIRQWIRDRVTQLHIDGTTDVYTGYMTGRDTDYIIGNQEYQDFTAAFNVKMRTKLHESIKNVIHRYYDQYSNEYNVATIKDIDLNVNVNWGDIIKNTNWDQITRITLKYIANSQRNNPDIWKDVNISDLINYDCLMMYLDDLEIKSMLIIMSEDKKDVDSRSVHIPIRSSSDLIGAMSSPGKK